MTIQEYRASTAKDAKEIREANRRALLAAIAWQEAAAPSPTLETRLKAIRQTPKAAA